MVDVQMRAHDCGDGARKHLRLLHPAWQLTKVRTEQRAGPRVNQRDLAAAAHDVAIDRDRVRAHRRAPGSNQQRLSLGILGRRNCIERQRKYPVQHRQHG